jgi:hypothetical protein
MEVSIGALAYSGRKGRPALWYLFGESRYEGYRGSVELLIQYKAGDFFMFQDGVGPGKQRLAFLPPYRAAAREAAQMTGRELEVSLQHPDYMTPLRGVEAERLFQAYVRSRVTAKPD